MITDMPTLNQDDDNDLLSFSDKEKKKKLGQFLTPPALAAFMASLLEERINAHHSILDPCIGPNTLLSAFSKLLSKDITGIEIDRSSIPSDNLFFNQAGRQLLIDNFLHYPLSRQFDFIVLNPPYVRQELLIQGHNSKEKAIKIIGPALSALIPPKSNLYVYFLIKSLLHLKENGELVAVIYDSWLYNAFGKGLKKALTESGSIKSIYHIREAVFEGVDVGATVIHFIRKLSKDPIAYYNIDNIGTLAAGDLGTSVYIDAAKFIAYKFGKESKLQFDSDFFVPLKTLSATLKRGTAACINDYFLHPVPKFKESVPIIKDIGKIKQYSTEVPTAYLLLAGKNPSGPLKRYLQQIKKEIMQHPEQYSAVRNKIALTDYWYKVYVKKPGNFLFNYYLRNNIDFILNEKRYYASDNFYVLNIPSNVNIYLAILNSGFTRNAILRNSRSQGNGLKKLQLYEFKEIPVINLSMLTQSALDQLDKLGDTLKKINRYESKKQSVIEAIDLILLKEYNRHTKTSFPISEL